MRLTTWLLHPVLLFLMAVAGCISGGAAYGSYGRGYTVYGLDGLVTGCFVFAGAALSAAVLRAGQLTKSS